MFFFLLENFTIQALKLADDETREMDIRLTFYVKERGAYICFNQRWQPRLMVGFLLINLISIY